MVIFGELFQSLANLVQAIYIIIFWLLAARIVVSWFPIDPYNNVVQFLIQTTEPILAPFRRLPLHIGMIDLTPLIAIFTLRLASKILIYILASAAARFGVLN